MRKLLILAILVAVLFFSYNAISKGATFGIFSIEKYSYIQQKSEELDNSVKELESKINTQYGERTNTLNNSIERYKISKQEFTELEEIQKEAAMSTIDLVDVDFLWTIVGNYATENDVALQFDVKESVLKQTESTTYILGDLYFKAEGNYADVTQFINDVEDDDRLEFEISCFEMKKHEIKLYDEKNMTQEEREYEEERQENWVDASFVVKGIPLNSISITKVTTPEEANAINEINGVLTNQAQ